MAPRAATPAMSMQNDGTTLIANVADNASADFIWNATAALWFQK